MGSNLKVPNAWDEIVPVQLPRDMIDQIVAVCGNELAIFKGGGLNAALTQVGNKSTLNGHQESTIQVSQNKAVVKLIHLFVNELNLIVHRQVHWYSFQTAAIGLMVQVPQN